MYDEKNTVTSVCIGDNANNLVFTQNKCYGRIGG